MPVQTRSMTRKQSTSISTPRPAPETRTQDQPESVQPTPETRTQVQPTTETITQNQSSNDEERLNRYSKFSSSVIKFIRLVSSLKNEHTVKIMEGIEDCTTIIRDACMYSVYTKMYSTYCKLVSNINKLSGKNELSCENKVKTVITLTKMICPILSVSMVIIDCGMLINDLNLLVKTAFKKSYKLQIDSLNMLKLNKLSNNIVDELKEEMEQFRSDLAKIIRENPMHLSEEETLYTE
jgi:hypothetical protein